MPDIRPNRSVEIHVTTVIILVLHKDNYCLDAAAKAIALQFIFGLFTSNNRQGHVMMTESYMIVIAAIATTTLLVTAPTFQYFFCDGICRLMQKLSKSE